MTWFLMSVIVNFTDAPASSVPSVPWSVTVAFSSANGDLRPLGGFGFTFSGILSLPPVLLQSRTPPVVQPAATKPWPVYVRVALSTRAARQPTAIVAGPAEGLPSLDVVTCAVFESVEGVQFGRCSGVVGLVMWTWTSAPGARSVPGPPKPSTPPTSVQVPVVFAPSIDQTTPGTLVGGVSETVTSRAIPVPLFLTLIV